MGSLLDLIRADYERVEADATLSTEEKISERCRFFFEGRIFISHSAGDRAWCAENIVPIVDEISGPRNYFFMDIGAALPEIANAYRFMVQYGLYWAKTIIIVVSRKAVLSPWVALELRWALEQRHPIIACRVDDTEPAALDERLAFAGHSGDVPGCVVDFGDAAPAQVRLRSLLSEERFAPAHPGDPSE
jgi:hypothetical protein